MKTVKLDDLTYEMLKDLAKRKDPLGVTAHMTELIRNAHKEKK